VVSEVPEMTRGEGGSPTVDERSGWTVPPRYEPWPGHDAGLPAPPGHPAAPGPAGRPPRRPSGLIAAIVAVLLALTAGLGVWLVTSSGTAVHHGTSRASGGASGVTDAQAAVVDVNTSSETSSGDGLQPLGAGTGMIITPSGEVLTNNHVVSGASAIQVSIQGRAAPVDARVVGVDTANDVALLQLEGVSGLPTVTLGDSSELSLGDDVTAMGNAFGRGGPPTVTKGTVTDLHRSIVARDPSGGTAEHLPDVIQVDAEIHPGDSGGALLNEAGEVVGMITAGPSGQNPGATPKIGFAIPVNVALDIVQQIRAGNGTATILLGKRGFLGVHVVPGNLLTPAQVQQIDQQLGIDPNDGAVVVGFAPESHAPDAGMEAPAVVRAIDGEQVHSAQELGDAVHQHTPGQTVSVTWVDRHGSHSANVVLIPGPAV
jgi:S1-C subfamily serine protease